MKLDMEVWEMLMQARGKAVKTTEIQVLYMVEYKRTSLRLISRKSSGIYTQYIEPTRRVQYESKKYSNYRN
jgi:hypothetical protein